jgi:hypothetical protein
VQHCKTIEKRGVPTVALVTQSFTDSVRGLKPTAGFPTQRLYFHAAPHYRASGRGIRQIILGNDPGIRQPLFQEIVDGLTVSDPDDQKTGSIETPRPLNSGLTAGKD